MPEPDSVEFQRARYDEEAQAYDRHHGDPLNQRYRGQFIRKRLFALDLQDKSVLDAMAASGTETGFLLERGAQVTGLDISPNNARLYEKIWGRKCVVRSVHETGFADNSFDLVYVCGGLHHVLPLLKSTIVEVHRILKPGGYFCFVEPNADTFLNRAREFWYKQDKRFHESETAISYKDCLTPFLKLGFAEELVFFGGNVAYVLIGQSLILGVPRWLKSLTFIPLVVLESTLGLLPFAPRLFFAARWRKLE